VLVVLWALYVVTWESPELAGVAVPDGYVRVRGVVHVHTTLSDGGGSPKEVIAAAREADLDFIVISDHNNLDAFPFEGNRDGVLVLVGSEVSTTAGHILGIGLQRDPVYRFSGTDLDALTDIRDLGGFSFAAHPLSPREDLRFVGWDLPGPWGMELLNGDSEWRRAGPRLFLTVLAYPLNPRYALLGSLSAPDKTLGIWDKMLLERDVVGIYGADAHSRLPIVSSLTLRIPSYESVFSLASNYVLLESPLTGEGERDKAAILAALRSGMFYVGIDALGSASGFSFTVHGPHGQQWTMGEKVALQDGLVARVGGRVPTGSRVRLLRNGQTLAEEDQALEVGLPNAGVYRAEVHVDGWPVPWVMSNSIAILDRGALRERRKRAAWPSPPMPDGPIESIDAFDGQTTFHPGHDPASRMSSPILDPNGGIGGTGAARLAFRLARPTPKAPHVFAAIASWEHRNLFGYQGLTFQIRANGVYRLWVQVRDENPASANEGTEWWFASVKTSTEWRRIAVPFAHLRSIEPNTDGNLDLDKVRAIVFVVDKGSVKPGTAGTVWIDEVGVY